MPTLLLIDETGRRDRADALRIERHVEGLRVRVAHSMEEGAAIAADCRPDLALIYPGPRAAPERLRGEIARLPSRLGCVVLGEDLPDEARAATGLHVRPGDLGWLAGLADASSSQPQRGPAFDRHGAINQLSALLSGLRAMELALKAEATPETADALGRRLAPLLEAARQLCAALCSQPGAEEIRR